MGTIIRVALMFFFIQFLVVMSIMTVALLLARVEAPGLVRPFRRGSPKHT